MNLLGVFLTTLVDTVESKSCKTLFRKRKKAIEVTKPDEQEKADKEDVADDETGEEHLFQDKGMFECNVDLENGGDEDDGSDLDKQKVLDLVEYLEEINAAMDSSLLTMLLVVGEASYLDKTPEEQRSVLWSE